MRVSRFGPKYVVLTIFHEDRIPAGHEYGDCLSVASSRVNGNLRLFSLTCHSIAHSHEGLNWAI